MKHVGVTRKSAPEYFEIVKDVEGAASRFSTRHAIIPAYSEKESFGDLDCLIVPAADEAGLKSSLVEAFCPTDIKKNGDVLSLDYKGLQLDFICTPDEFFDSSLHYYSFNDVSNLIGLVALKMGLKYGHKGLL